MSEHPERPQYVRQVRLASGRHVHVVYFDGAATSCGDPDLSVCGTCGCDSVQPRAADPVGRVHWQVSMRCPNCRWEGTGVVASEALERFDAKRSRHTEELRRALDELSLANMEEDAERFGRALDADHIQPSDF